MPQEKSAGAAVFRKKDNITYYLLLHYQPGHWDLPKGHIEKGESEEETVKREVEEETGLKDIQIVGGFREKIKYFFRAEGRNVFKTVIFYLAETKTEEIKISPEHTGYKWLPYDEALKKLTFKNAKNILKKANAYIFSGKSLQNSEKNPEGKSFNV